MEEIERIKLTKAHIKRWLSSQMGSGRPRRHTAHTGTILGYKEQRIRPHPGCRALASGVRDQR